MDTNTKAVYIQAMIACAMIELAGMQAENQERLIVGQSLAYGEKQFLAVIEKYGIHHNAVLSYLQQH